MPWQKVRLATPERDGARALNGNDKCFVLYEYVPGGAFAEYPGTQMMMNFKKSPDCNCYEKQYRQSAIDQLTEDLEDFFESKDVTNSIIIVIPSSKMKSDRNYSMRFEDLAKRFNRGKGIKILFPINIKENIGNAHEDNIREIDIIYDNLTFDSSTIPQGITTVYILDDILTKGSHFKACEKLIKEIMPRVIIYGIFFAQTTRE